MKITVGANTPPVVLAEMARLGPVRWSPRNDWILYRDGDTLRVGSPDGARKADLGPVPPGFDLAEPLNELAYRGFSLVT
jgi:hypothetical protein